MPVLRTIKTYRHRGKKRFVRLYRSWYNLRDRVQGKTDGRGNRIWFGLEVEWKSFEEFRAWALAHGYSKLHCSLDRERSNEGYTAKNCRWTTVRYNSLRALHGDDPYEMGGVTRPQLPECPF